MIATGGGAVLNEENSWSHVFNLQKKTSEDGKPYTYYASEDEIEGYEYETTYYTVPEDAGEENDDGETGSPVITVTNTPDNSMINIPVTKIWDGDEGNANARPDHITFTLQKKVGDEYVDVTWHAETDDGQGEEVPLTLTLTKADAVKADDSSESGSDESDGEAAGAANQWQGEFLGVPEKDEYGEVIEYAVKGMLPKNRLGAKMYKKLNVYAGAEHPHAAQKPEKIELNIR